MLKLRFLEIFGKALLCFSGEFFGQKGEGETANSCCIPGNEHEPACFLALHNNKCYYKWIIA